MYSHVTDMPVAMHNNYLTRVLVADTGMCSSHLSLVVTFLFFCAETLSNMLIWVKIRASLLKKKYTNLN